MLFKNRQKKEKEKKISVKEIAALLFSNDLSLEENKAVSSEKEEAVNDSAQPLIISNQSKAVEDLGGKRLGFKIFVIITFLAGGYLLKFFYLSNFLSWQQIAYIFTPVYWLVLAVFVLYSVGFDFKKFFLKEPALISLAFVFGCIYALVNFLAGFLFEFGRSPYLFTLESILLNVVLAVSTLVGIEFSRAYLVDRISKYSFLAGLLVPVLLFSAVSLSPSKYQLFFHSEEARPIIAFLLASFLPLLSENLLASLLAFFGGPLAAIAYLLPIKLFHWLSPILPKLLPGASGFIGVFLPVLAILFLSYKYQEKIPEAQFPEKIDKSNKENSFSTISWTITFFLIFLIVFLFSGGTGLVPKLVAGRSMAPSINLGDVVFVRQVKPAEIKKNDVIMFQQDKMVVIHRVIQIKKNDSSVLFITKGDANRKADRDPVSFEKVYGKVVLIIPKVGWLAIPVKNFLASFF